MKLGLVGSLLLVAVSIGSASIAPGPFAARVALAAPRPPALAIQPPNVRFGRLPFETFVKRGFTITNRSREELLVTVESIVMPDDFSPGQIESTCTLGETLLAPGGECTHVVGFRPTEFFAGRELAVLRVSARDAGGELVDEREVRLTGRGF